jgi:hypothetical protein
MIGLRAYDIRYRRYSPLFPYWYKGVLIRDHGHIQLGAYGALWASV